MVGPGSGALATAIAVLALPPDTFGKARDLAGRNVDPHAAAAGAGGAGTQRPKSAIGSSRLRMRGSSVP